MAESNILNWDVTGADHEEREAFEKPKPGVYEAVITKAVNEVKIKGKEDRLHVQAKITKGKYKGWIGHDYIPHTENMKWKMDQILMAIEIDTAKKEKGKMTLDKAMVGKKVVIGVKNEDYNGDPTPKLNAWYKWKALASSDEDFEDPDEDDDDDADDADDDSDDDDDDSDDSEDDDSDDDDDDSDDDEDEDEDEEPEETPAQKKKRLKAEAAEAEKAAAAKAAKKSSKATGKAKPTEKTEDYKSWDTAKLKKELKSRELKTGGTDDALRARLRANDKDPFAG